MAEVKDLNLVDREFIRKVELLWNVVMGGGQRAVPGVMSPYAGWSESPQRGHVRRPQVPGRAVLVGIRNEETGSGKYGGWMFEDWAASNATDDLGIEVDQLHSPPHAFGPDVTRDYVLVVNVAEKGLANSHMLTGHGVGQRLGTWPGVFIGVTTESPPRPVVLIDAWPFYPCIVQITGTSGGTGCYVGKVMEKFWEFNSGTEIDPASFPAANNAHIINEIERTTLLRTALPTDGSIFLPGVITGRNSDGEACVVVDRITAYNGSVTAVTGSAGPTYTGTEQGMINNLKAAVGDIELILTNIGLYT